MSMMMLFGGMKVVGVNVRMPFSSFTHLEVKSQISAIKVTKCATYYQLVRQHSCITILMRFLLCWMPTLLGFIAVPPIIALSIYSNAFIHIYILSKHAHIVVHLYVPMQGWM